MFSQYTALIPCVSKKDPHSESGLNGNSLFAKAALIDSASLKSTSSGVLTLDFLAFSVKVSLSGLTSSPVKIFPSLSIVTSGESFARLAPGKVALVLLSSLLTVTLSDELITLLVASSSVVTSTPLSRADATLP